jgi:hypothetical protein
MTSSIDTSLIDSSKPEEGNPTTASVRSNILYIKAALNSAKSEVETLQTDVSSLNSAMRYMGGWDASVGTFPSSAQKGYVYSVSVAGTVDGVAFDVTDRINCILNNASTSVYAGNWLKEDYTDRVLSVFGRTGDITATTDDVTEASNKKYVTAAEKSQLAITSGTNTGDETGATIKSKLGITTLSGENTGDQTIYADGAWVTWTPTFTNLAVGNGSVVAKQKQIGTKTYAIKVWITLGNTGASVGVSPSFTLPVTSANTQPVAFGSGSVTDASPAGTYDACLILKTATEAFIGLKYIVGSYIGIRGLTSAIPVTFANGDIIYVEGLIETT